MMKSSKLAKNTLSSLIFQVTTIICGFILPRLILNSFGSEVNGLVNSISQFLGVIALMEMGVGAVVQSALYKPLADRDDSAISKIIVSAGKFFRRLAQILLGYIVVLMIVYPFIAEQNFGWVYSAGLIAAMSISSFAQYYFGVVDRLLLTADQRGYIQYTSQTITLIANTLACAVLIGFGASIHFVKLTTSLIYLVRPIVLRIYVKRHYNIDRKITYEGEPIKQKWNGVAQHIAAFVLDGTDSMVLTVFSTLSNVSIYSVYNLVIHGVTQLFLSMTNGIHALIGELWAKQKREELDRVFGWTEWSIHTGTTFVFGCVAMLILPFVQVYTLGIDDADYIQPLFAALLTLANAGHCLRLPYSMMILAAGHYKQTQHNYIISAAINIVLSIATVWLWGLVGVAIGTLAAMFYQTVWMAYYTSKHLIKWKFTKFLKQMAVDGLTVLIGCLLTNRFGLSSVSYIGWVWLAVKVALIWVVVVLLVNLLFYREKIVMLAGKVFGRGKRSA